MMLSKMFLFTPKQWLPIIPWTRNNQKNLWIYSRGKNSIWGAIRQKHILGKHHKRKDFPASNYNWIYTPQPGCPNRLEKVTNIYIMLLFSCFVTEMFNKDNTRQRCKVDMIIFAWAVGLLYVEYNISLRKLNFEQ